MSQKIILINALSKDSFDDCRITGSISVPLAELEREAGRFDKNALIVVYCASYECPVSRKAWHILHDLGFTNVQAYEGGVREWYQLGLPVEGACTAEYITMPNVVAADEDDDVITMTSDELSTLLERK